MDQEFHAQEAGPATEAPAKSRFLGICIIIAAGIIGLALVITSRSEVAGDTLSAGAVAELEQIILPNEGVVLPVKWGDLGRRMVENGTIDQKKFETLYAQRGGLDDATKQLLTGTDNDGRLVITKDNAGILLNLLWALGLGNRNEILEKGPMMDKRYGGADKFASTGGWTLASGNPMDHYSRHAMRTLTPDQQSLVERVSKNIYRPCCGNSTYFPDCNHGMAMLGLLELMASQNVSEADMYKAALAVNAYWFPDTYLTIGQFFRTQGMAWASINPKIILGEEYSSGAGFQNIRAKVEPIENKGGSGCGA